MAKKKTERQKKIDAIWKTVEEATVSNYEAAEALCSGKGDVKTAKAATSELNKRLKAARAELKKLEI